MRNLFGFKKQNSVICLILSHSFFPCLTLVLYSHLITVFCYKRFTSLLAFRRSHFSYSSSSLYAIVVISIQHVSWTFLRRAHLLRPSGRYGHQGISLFKKKNVFKLIFFSNLCNSEKKIDARS